MNSQKKSIGYLLEFTLLILSVVIFELSDKSSLFLGKLIFLISLVSSFQLLYKYRKIDILAIFLMFILAHIIYIYPYYFLNIPYHYLTSLQTLENTNFIFLIQLIVQRLIFFRINPDEFKPPRFFVGEKENSIVFQFFVLILLVLIPLSTRDLQTISANEGSYSIETKSSIWFEYSIIFIIVAGFYANTVLKKRIIILIGLIFMILPLLYGKRLAFLMVALTIFNLFFSGKFNVKYIYILFLVGFISLRVFAQIRVTGIANLDYKSLILGGVDKEVLSVGPGGVLVCSVTYYDLIKREIFDFYFSFKSFIGMFSSIFLPSSLNLSETYVNLECIKYENIPGNGGFPGIYFYLWGRYIGVFLGSLVINFLIKKSQTKGAYIVYGVFLLSTFPRWYTYNMHILIKMGVWLLIIYFFSTKLTKIRS